MIKAAIFDIDGTVLDSMPLWKNSGERYLKSLGLTPEENLSNKLFSMSLEEGGGYLKENYLFNYTVSQVINEFTAFLSSAYKTTVLPKKGVEDFLKKLQALHIPAVAATAGSENLFMPVLEKFSLLNFFSAFFTCGTYNTSKTKPDIYLTAAHFLKAKPEHTLVFEDTLIPIETAAKAGFKTAGVYDETSLSDKERIKQISSMYIEDYSLFDWTKIEEENA